MGNLCDFRGSCFFFLSSLHPAKVEARGQEKCLVTRVLSRVDPLISFWRFKRIYDTSLRNLLDLKLLIALCELEMAVRN